MRLIAFGCSQTYGHCLPDAYVENKKAWDGVEIADKPSQHAFPALIGRRLGIKTYNQSWPGSSNKFIWHSMVNFDYQPTDIVIVVWTLTNRTMVIRKDIKYHLGTWPSVNKLNQTYQKFVALSNSNENLELDSYGYVDHAHRVVAPQVKQILHYKLVSVELDNKPSWMHVDFIDSLDNMIYPNHDKALDNIHYGIKTHEFIAAKMLPSLTIAAN
jgi:hypothetical protein